MILITLFWRFPVYESCIESHAPAGVTLRYRPQYYHCPTVDIE